MLAAAIVTALAAAILVMRPSIVERWAIYASSTGGPPQSYPLFLEPFPTKFSCEVEARVIVQNGGHAFCRGHMQVILANRDQDILWSQFWPSAQWIALCRTRFQSRIAR
jgi:hypothetical protein